MFVQAKAVTNIALGVYLHIPFCARHCDFCNFYQESPERGLIGRYLKGLETELLLRPLDRPVETVFWGGGTPGLLPANDLKRLGMALKSQFSTAPAEWTVEMAPSTVKADKIEALLEMGVTRISMGVQSFNEARLEALGRTHSRKQVVQAIETIRSVGCKNLNLDMIFGIPGQSLEAWRDDLNEAIGFGPEHLSTYCLTFEEDTALWIKLQKGATKRFSDDEEAAFYEVSMDVLEGAGYPQYEISNFAQPGYACLHNRQTWKMQEWIGYGPSASSQFKGLRWMNPPSIDRWLEGVEAGQLIEEDRVILDSNILAADSLIFGLRMNEGVDLAQLKDRFSTVNWLPIEVRIGHWNQAGLIVLNEGCCALSRAGRMVADRIGTEILEVFDSI